MKQTIVRGDILEGDEKRPLEDRYVKLVAKVGSYEVYLNRKTKVVTFYATDYHAGNLTISRKGLEKLLQI